MEVVFAVILIVSVILNVASCSVHEDNHKKVIQLTQDKEQVIKERDALNTRFETMACEVRGLTITTVKGITLCMDPATKALHKIDSKAD